MIGVHILPFALTIMNDFNSISERLTLRLATDADKAFARHVHHQAYHDVIVRQFGEWNEAEQDAYFDSTWASYSS